MKLLTLNQFENAPYECVFDVKHLFVGSDTAPEVPEVCTMIQEKFNFIDDDGLYIEAWWDGELYEEIVAFLETVGYTLFEPTNIVLAYQG